MSEQTAQVVEATVRAAREDWDWATVREAASLAATAALGFAGVVVVLSRVPQVGGLGVRGRPAGRGVRFVRQGGRPSAPGLTSGGRLLA
jgi:hypothetical protein